MSNIRMPIPPDRPRLQEFIEYEQRYRGCKLNEFFEALAGAELVPLEWFTSREYGNLSTHRDCNDQWILLLSALDNARQAELIVREKISYDIRWIVNAAGESDYYTTVAWFGAKSTHRLYELGVYISSALNMMTGNALYMGMCS